MPGGALTANTQMLRDNGIMEKYPEIIKAMSDVVRRGGYGTSVTPVSQFYFQQAFNNVMFGPWEKIAESYGMMVLGYFGRTPVPADPEVVRIAAEQLGMEPTTRPPIEINDEDPTKGVAAAKKVLEAEHLAVTDENVFIVSTCKEKGVAFLKGEAKSGIRKDEPAVATGTPSTTALANEMTLTVNGRDYAMKVNGEQVTVNGRVYRVGVSVGASTAAPTAAATASGPSTSVQAKMPGLVLRIGANVGDTVKAGDQLLVLEAMKMEVPVAAPVDGVIRAILVSTGDHVVTGETLAEIC
jgi:pyruvate carboxylase subunit B